MTQKSNNEFKKILDGYNEMQMGELAGHTMTLAFTMSMYYKQLCELGVDIETARQLVVALQNSVANNGMFKKD